MRWLALYTRTYVLWVVVFGLVAFYFPAPFTALQPNMTWLFGLTMFGIGVALEPEDFKRIARQPAIVAVGVVTQYSVMPLGAFAVAWLLELPAPVAAGLILTGAAPGAMASNVMSYIAKADTAYSISLTTASTLLSPVLTPGLTLLLAGTKLEVSFARMCWDVCIMVVFPLLAGFAVRTLWRERVEKILPIFPAISATFIVFICAVVIAANRNALTQITGTVLVACVGLNLFGLIMGYAVARACRMPPPRRKTLALEIGMQNAGLGAVLALKHLGQEAAVPAAIFVFVCILNASLLTGYWRRRAEAEVPAASATDSP